MLAVAEGKDPAAERKAERITGTFADLAAHYVELHAKKHNRSWLQSETLVAKHLFPRWGKLKAHAITRADVRLMMARIEAPILANQVLKSASAIFSWAVKQEMITAIRASRSIGIRPRPRARALRRRGGNAMGDVRPGAEVDPVDRPRPGEVAAMQREHIAEGWWQMPGQPTGSWSGTKNARDHRVGYQNLPKL